MVLLFVNGKPDYTRRILQPPPQATSALQHSIRANPRPDFQSGSTLPLPMPHIATPTRKSQPPGASRHHIHGFKIVLVVTTRDLIGSRMATRPEVSRGHNGDGSVSCCTCNTNELVGLPKEPHHQTSSSISMRSKEGLTCTAMQVAPAAQESRLRRRNRVFLKEPLVQTLL